MSPADSFLLVPFVRDLLSRIQHDLKNPAMVVDLALQDKGADAELLEAATSAMERMRNIFKEIDQLSRLLSVNPESLPLSSLLEGFAQIPASLTNTKVVVDSLLFAQTLAQLHENTRRLGANVNVEVSSSNAGTIEVSVSDWSAPLNETQLKSVFSPTLASSTLTGDPVARRLSQLWRFALTMTAMGGDLKVESPGRDGASTTVVLILKCA